MVEKGTILVLVAALNMVFHWAPWELLPFFVDGRRRLRPVVAYVQGCLTILLGGALFAHRAGGDVAAWSAWWALLGIVAAAGAGTLLPRLLEYVIEHRSLKNDGAHYEQAIDEIRREVGAS